MLRTDVKESLATLKKKLKLMEAALRRAPQPDEHGHLRDRDRDSKCALACSTRDADARHTCLSHCRAPAVPWAEVEKYAQAFPIDIQRLQTDAKLKKHFLRHQMNTGHLPDTSDEAHVIADLYSMPVSLFVLPSTAWHHAFIVITNPDHHLSLRLLIQNWKDRRSVFTEEAWKRLGENIERYDHQDIVVNALRQAAAPADDLS